MTQFVSHNRLNSSTLQCAFHICRICAANSQRDNQLYVSADKKCPQSQLCSNHRCLYSNLCTEKRENSSEYCSSHKCYMCKKGIDYRVNIHMLTHFEHFDSF